MSQFSQLFPPCPKFTDKDVPDQSGKVFIVTGGASGVGFEVSRILYGKNAIVYIATRTASKIQNAIEDMRRQCPNSQGRLKSLILDLANLATIKPAVENFISKEQRLDVLFNNAGVMGTNPDEKSAQGYEMQMGTNALGPFLLTKLLEPILLRTAAQENSFGNTRIVWVSSMLDIGTPKGGVVWVPQLGTPSLHPDMMANYMQSKTGVTFLGHEFAKKLGGNGIISTISFAILATLLSLHPGMLKAELQRNMPAPVRTVMVRPIYGAYTELYAGFSPEITSKDNGRYIIPWGRLGLVPDHMAGGMRPKEEGGTGSSEKFWDWCEAATRSYR
ncbi:NAD(P)-binding protein [Hypoxylon sp. EC38]|nr:NAD(P)-binding protein [Hypoxylon sp. EC38]